MSSSTAVSVVLLIVTGLPTAFQVPCTANDYCLWSSWSPCSVTCGLGVRFRVSLTPGCLRRTGSETERQFCTGKHPNCSLLIPIDCKFGSWSKWTNCSVDCGIGWKSRHRKALKPLLAHCNEMEMTVDVCVGVAHKCTGVLCGNATWSDWEKCSVSSGRGMQMRRRDITSDAILIPGCYEIRSCEVPSHTISPTTLNKTCSSSWTAWSTCSHQIRMRVASNCSSLIETQLCDQFNNWTAGNRPTLKSRTSEEPSGRTSSRCSIVQWLSDSNLTQYLQHFNHNNVSMKHLMLFGLTNLDLDTMQVIDPTARKRVMDSVSQIRCPMSGCDISLCPIGMYLGLQNDSYNCGYCCQCVDPKTFAQTVNSLGTMTVSLIAALAVTLLLTVTFFVLWRRRVSGSAHIAFNDSLVSSKGFDNPAYASAVDGREMSEAGASSQSTVSSLTTSMSREETNRSQKVCTSDKSSQVAGSAATTQAGQLPCRSRSGTADFTANYDCLPSQYMLESVHSSQRHSSTSCSSSNRTSCQSGSTGTSDLRSSLASSVISQ